MTATSLAITHTVPHKEAEQVMVEIESLAQKVYKSSIVLPSGLLFRWFQRNPRMWWLARENNRLMGYMCAMPLKHEAFLKTLQPGFDESTSLTDNDIRKWNDGADTNYFMYICSLVVDPDYQKRSDLSGCRLLIKHFLESLLLYGKNGSTVVEWSGMAVSEAGCHILQRYLDLSLLTRDNHDHSIWHGKTSREHQEQLLQRLLQKSQP